MAQYKVPQDVEADDKLIGPFSFRQFVYLLIAAGLIALAVAFFQIFPLLAIIPVPFILLLAALALPLKKDQPMETYLAAIVSYYLKPRTRRWVPGQRDTTISISAPKIVDDEVRTRNITGEEATHRLSFLADIVDTQGYAIKGAGLKKMNEELVAEANSTNDIFETHHFDDLENTIVKDENERHEKVVQDMQDAIREDKSGNEAIQDKNEKKTEMWGYDGTNQIDMDGYGPNFDSDVVVKPNSEIESEERARSNIVEKPAEKKETIKAKPSIIELANNTEYSIATISKEANRLKERDEGEVFISLH